MPHPEIHEKIDLEIFGKSFPEVHKWIDGTFNGSNGRVHWLNRHYKMAILEHFSPVNTPEKHLLVSVAMIHVMVDWLYYYQRLIFPLTREDVERELRSQGVWIPRSEE